MEKTQFEAKQKIMRYYTMITKGCGNVSCKLSFCLSNPKNSITDLDSPSKSVLKAIDLYKTNSPLCKRLQNLYIPKANSNVNTSSSNEKENEKDTKEINETKGTEIKRKNLLDKKIATVWTEQNENYKIDIPILSRDFFKFVLYVQEKLIKEENIEIDRFYLKSILVSEDGKEIKIEKNTELTETLFDDLITMDQLTRMEIEFKTIKLSLNEEEAEEILLEEEKDSYKTDCFWMDLYSEPISIHSKLRFHSKECISSCFKGKIKRFEKSKSETTRIENENGFKITCKSVLFSGIEKINSMEEMNEILSERIYVYIICFGGKFVIAFYRNGQVLQHQSLSRYVIRKKQGGRQVNKEVSHSAGSYMRRYHEQRLKEEINETLENSKDLLAKSSVLLYFAPGQLNKNYIFLKRDKNLIANLRAERITSFKKTPLNANFEEIIKIERRLRYAVIFPPENCGC